MMPPARRFALAASLALACALGACNSEPPPPSGTISSEAAQKLILERDAARDAAAARERVLEAKISGLEAEVADLRSQLGLARESAEQADARAAQYEKGLGKAVDQLNQVSREAADAKADSAASAYRAAVAESAPRAAEARVHSLSAPMVQFLGEQVIVTGTLWNAGDGAASGRLIVELMRDGQPVNQQEQPFEIGPRTDQAWSATFHAPGFEGTYSARVRMDY